MSARYSSRRATADRVKAGQIVREVRRKALVDKYATDSESRARLEAMPYGQIVALLNSGDLDRPKLHAADERLHDRLVRLDQAYGTDPSSPLHHDNRPCSCNGYAMPRHNR